MDKFNQWFSQVDGKAIEAEDASNYAQCFDLAFNWCDFLGIPRDSIRHLNAFQIFTTPNPDTTQYFDIVANTPTGVPQVGALVIWGTSVGPAGHVAIFKEGDTNSFRSEDQNWSGIQKAKLVNHTYNGVLGWLQPKTITDTHANDLTKMLNWDATCDYFKLDRLDKSGATILISQFETLTKSLADKDQELTNTRAERDKALSQVCPDPSAHTGSPGGTEQPSTPDSPPSPPSGSSDGDTGNPTPQAPSVQTNPFQRLIDFISKLFGK